MRIFFTGRTCWYTTNKCSCYGLYSNHLYVDWKVLYDRVSVLCSTSQSIPC